MHNIVQELRSVLFAPNSSELVKELISPLQPYDLAQLLLELENREQVQFIEVLPLEQAVEVLEYLEPEVQYRLLHHADEERAKELLQILPSDTTVDLLLAIHPNQAQVLRGWLPEEYGKLIDNLMTFPENTAGSLATVDYVAARAGWTVEQTLAHIRKVGKDAELISYVYVLNPRGQLIDVVSIKELILASPQTKLSELVSKNPISVRADSDQEEAARLLSQYDFLAIPVVAHDNRMVGIISVDDLVDVIQDEATEDIQKLGGSEPLPEAYLKTPIGTIFRKRVSWLLLLFLAQGITGSIMERYSEVLSQVIALTFFIPLLIDAGGNAGSQTVATLVRALAIGEITVKDTWKALRKEVVTGILLGTVVGAAAFLRTRIMGVTGNLSHVVALSALFIVTWASTMAALLPMLLHKLKVDPAIVSGPVITTLVDAVGIFGYFTIARLLLGIG
ncbi:MAG: magnesium transporter [Firmicutes bacterium]|nr:magnesium transporter [Bacillota bacterium]